MPYPNQHAARLVDPKKFKNYARITNEAWPKGIVAILGWNKKDQSDSSIQAFRGNADEISYDDFKKFIKDHVKQTPIDISEATNPEKKFEDKVSLAESKADERRKRIFFALPDKYSHITFKPTEAMKRNAQRALDKRREKPFSQRGMTDVGIARARDIINGKLLSPETVRRMYSYFSRHEVDKQGMTWDDYGKGRQAWDGWGGDEGFAWSRKIVDQMNKADEKVNSLNENLTGENNMLNLFNDGIDNPLQKDYPLPEGLTLGKPFLTLAKGQNYARMSGKKVGSEITDEVLGEILRVFKENKNADPVIIDWNHATAMSNKNLNPDEQMSLGIIVDAELTDKGLYVIPAYNEKGLEVVKNAGGVLWSSPEFLVGDIFSREDGKKIGKAQLLAVTLTNRPAQRNNKIETVTLSEYNNMEFNQEELMKLSPEELVKMCMEKHQMVMQLQAELEAKTAELEGLKAEMEAKQQEDAQEPGEPADSPMAQEDKEKKMMSENKLSETQSLLLNELNAQVIALSERTKSLEEEKNKLNKELHASNRKNAVDSLLNTGKISPAEVELAEKAYNFKDQDASFWNMFSERRANTAVPLQVNGTSASASEMTLAEHVRTVAKEKSLTFSEALSYVKINNPETYKKHYGV